MVVVESNIMCSAFAEQQLCKLLVDPSFPYLKESDIKHTRCAYKRYAQYLGCFSSFVPIFLFENETQIAK